MSKKSKIIAALVAVGLIGTGGYFASQGGTGLYKGFFLVEETPSIQLSESIAPNNSIITNSDHNSEITNIMVPAGDYDDDEITEPLDEEKDINTRTNDSNTSFGVDVKAGIKPGIPDGSSEPERSINRSESAKMIPNREDMETIDLNDTFTIRDPNEVSLFPNGIIHGASDYSITTVQVDGINPKVRISGSTDVRIGCFDITQHSGKDEVRVKEMNFSINSLSEINHTHLTTISLVDIANNKVHDQVSKFDSNNKVKFEDLFDLTDYSNSVAVSGNSTKRYCVTADIDSNAHSADTNYDGQATLVLNFDSIEAKNIMGRDIQPFSPIPFSLSETSFAPSSTLKIEYNEGHLESREKTATIPYSPNPTAQTVYLGVWSLTSNNDSTFVDKIKFEIDMDDDPNTLSSDETAIANLPYHKAQLFDLTNQQIIANSTFKIVGTKVIAEFDQINNQLLVPQTFPQVAPKNKNIGLAIKLDKPKTTLKIRAQILEKPTARSKSNGMLLNRPHISADLGVNNDKNLANDKNDSEVTTIK